MREHLEVTNHKKAIDLVDSLIRKKTVTEADILEINAIILDRIIPDLAGFYRASQVLIRGSDYHPPSASKVPQLMREFIKKLNAKTEHPIEHAAYVHFDFVHIHPFIDGNGREARLLMNLILLRAGYPPCYILNAERKKYIDSLERAHKGDMQPFFNIVARAIERSLDLYLEMLDKEFDSDYMTLAEASKQCKYSQEYLSLLARKGRIEAIKFGRNWMISKKALNEYFKVCEWNYLTNIPFFSLQGCRSPSRQGRMQRERRIQSMHPGIPGQGSLSQMRQEAGCRCLK